MDHITNDDRAEWAEAAVTTHATHPGLPATDRALAALAVYANLTGVINDEPSTQFADLLCDLHHYADRVNIPWADALPQIERTATTGSRAHIALSNLLRDLADLAHAEGHDFLHLLAIGNSNYDEEILDEEYDL